MADSRYLQIPTPEETHKNNVNFIPIFGPYERQFISQWNNSGVHSDILKVFNEMNIVQMKPLHQNGFSYLMKNYNLALIDHSKTQSFSYLASILTSLMNNYDNKNNVATGIQAIILSSSTESCNKLEILTKTLISKAQIKINVIVSFAAIAGDITIENLYNGKGRNILITTPISLIHLLDILKNYKWQNLRHFVFDDLDILLNDYVEQMDFFSNLLNLLKNKNPVQLISASVKWNHAIDNYLNGLFVKWQYIFGSHLDAVHYMNIQFNIVEVDKGDKIDLMLGYIVSREACRWIIFTSSTEQAKSISNYILKRISCMEILIPGQMNSDIRFALNKWNAPLEKNHRLWICSDVRLYDFYIDNADCIIHFNVPYKKEIFSMRFSVLQDSSNTLTNKERNAYMFFDETDEKKELDDCINILKEYGVVNIPFLYSSINTKSNQTESDNSLTEEIVTKEEAAGPNEFELDATDNEDLWTKGLEKLIIVTEEDTSDVEPKNDDSNKRNDGETDE